MLKAPPAPEVMVLAKLPAPEVAVLNAPAAPEVASLKTELAPDVMSPKTELPPEVMSPKIEVAPPPTTLVRSLRTVAGKEDSRRHDQPFEVGQKRCHVGVGAGLRTLSLCADDEDGEEESLKGNGRFGELHCC